MMSVEKSKAVKSFAKPKDVWLDKYHVYVGETKNFFRRTEEHYDKMKEYSSCVTCSPA